MEIILYVFGILNGAFSAMNFIAWVISGEKLHFILGCICAVLAVACFIVASTQ